MTYIKPVALLLLSLIYIAPATALAQQTGPGGCYVIDNASFENQSNGTIANWTGSSWGGSQARYSLRAPGFDSANAGTIDTYAFTPNTSAKIRSQLISVNANANLALRFHARGTASNVQLQVVQLNRDANVIAHTWINTVPLNSNANAWGEYANTFYSLAETVFVQIEFVVKSLGNVSLDNVRLSIASRAQSCNNESIQNSEPQESASPTGTVANRSPYSLSNAELAAGVVFSRTDNTEYRWVQTISGNSVGNQWISQACAQRLSTTMVQGTWRDLSAIAPLFDSIASPCNNQSINSTQTNNSTQTPINDPLRAEIRLTPNGYVFERTDKNEFRWVDQTSSGAFSSQWISDVCAKRLGAVRKVLGTWSDLVRLAPSTQGVVPPC